MLIYGSQMYFKKNVVKIHGVCEHCGGYGRLKSYQGQKFGHLYFIPLIPMGSKAQVIDECANCSMGSHVPIDNVPSIVDPLQSDLQSWVQAIENGQSEIDVYGEPKPVSVGVLIAQSLKDLYTLCLIQDVGSIVQILTGKGLHYEANLVQGRWAELHGDLDGAKRFYRQASDMNRDEPLPLYWLGCAGVMHGDSDTAEDAFKKYLFMVPDDLSAYVELATLYESTNNWDKIVRTYDKLYAMNPEMLQHKPMSKVYKKACKKSGQQGQFLNRM